MPLQTKTSGFTIIETMVAAGILATMLLSAITLMVKVNDLILINQRTITATYLAQECQELVRNMRDSAWKQNLRWNCGFEPAHVPPGDNNFFVISNDPIPTVFGDRPGCLDGGVDPQMNGSQRLDMMYTDSLGTPPNDFLVRDIKALDSDDNEIIVDYYRSVTFDYNDFLTGNCTNADSTECQGVTARCRTWWYGNNGREHEVEITQRLTNWFKR